MTTTEPDLSTWWADVLAVRSAGPNRFEAGPARSAFPRIYGGQLAAQGLLAAAATVEPEREPHQVHTLFLRGGDPTAAITYAVESVRDSRTLSTRLIRAEQDGRLLATATASFHVPSGLGPDHDTGSVDGVPAPDTLLTRSERLEAFFGDEVPPSAALQWPVDERYVDRAPWDPPSALADPYSPRNRIWMRAAGDLPDVPHVHAAALTFATDFPMYEPVIYPHAIDWTEMINGRTVYSASLDHAVWFHRPHRFDDWGLLQQVSPAAARSRGFSRAEFRGSDGLLVATVAQEIAFVEPR
jgi:acyl-CoA thioesterase-2